MEKSIEIICKNCFGLLRISKLPESENGSCPKCSSPIALSEYLPNYYKKKEGDSVATLISNSDTEVEAYPEQPNQEVSLPVSNEPANTPKEEVVIPNTTADIFSRRLSDMQEKLANQIPSYPKSQFVKSNHATNKEEDLHVHQLENIQSSLTKEHEELNRKEKLIQGLSAELKKKQSVLEEREKALAANNISHASQIRDLEEESERVRKEASTRKLFEKKIVELTRELDSIKQESTRNVQAKLELESLLAERDAIIAQQKEEFTANDSKIKEVTQEIIRREEFVEGQQRELEQTKEALEKEGAKLEEEKTNLKALVKDLNFRLVEVQKSEDVVAKQLSDQKIYQSALEKERAELDLLKVDIKAQELAIEKSLQDIAQKNQNILEIQDLLKSEKENFELDKEKWQKTVEQKADEYREFDEAKKKLEIQKVRLNETQKLLEEKENELKVLDTQLEARAQKIASAQEEIEHNKLKLSAQENEILDFSNKLKEYELNFRKSKELLITEQALFEERKAKFEKSQEDLEHKERDLLTLDQKIAAQFKEIEREQVQLLNSRKQLSSDETRFQSLTEKLKDAESEFETRKRELEKKEETLLHKEAEISKKARILEAEKLKKEAQQIVKAEMEESSNLKTHNKTTEAPEEKTLKQKDVEPIPVVADLKLPDLDAPMEFRSDEEVKEVKPLQFVSEEVEQSSNTSEDLKNPASSRFSPANVANNKKPIYRRFDEALASKSNNALKIVKEDEEEPLETLAPQIEEELKTTPPQVEEKEPKASISFIDPSKNLKVPKEVDFSAFEDALNNKEELEEKELPTLAASHPPSKFVTPEEANAIQNNSIDHEFKPEKANKSDQPNKRKKNKVFWSIIALSLLSILSFITIKSFNKNLESTADLTGNESVIHGVNDTLVNNDTDDLSQIPYTPGATSTLSMNGAGRIPETPVQNTAKLVKPNTNYQVKETLFSRGDNVLNLAPTESNFSSTEQVMFVDEVDYKTNEAIGMLPSYVE